VDGERKKCKDKIQYAMDRVFGSDYQNGEKYRQKSDEVKCIHLVNYYKTLAPSKMSWANV